MRLTWYPSQISSRYDLVLLTAGAACLHNCPFLPKTKQSSRLAPAISLSKRYVTNTDWVVTWVRHDAGPSPIVPVLPLHCKMMSHCPPALLPGSPNNYFLLFNIANMIGFPVTVMWVGTRGWGGQISGSQGAMQYNLICSIIINIGIIANLWSGTT